MRKIYQYLLLFIVAASLTIGFVAAAELVETDFDGNFKALAPKNAQFENQTGEAATVYIDMENNICYIYAENENIDEDTIDGFLVGFTKTGDFEEAGTDGDLFLLKCNDEEFGTDGVLTYGEGKVLIVTGDDLNELKKIAKSAKF